MSVALSPGRALPPGGRARAHGHRPAPPLQALGGRAEAGVRDDLAEALCQALANCGARSRHSTQPRLRRGEHTCHPEAQAERGGAAPQRDALAVAERREVFAVRARGKLRAAVDDRGVDERRGRHRREHRASVAAARDELDRAHAAHHLGDLGVGDQRSRIGRARRVLVCGDRHHALQRAARDRIRGSRPASRRRDGGLEVGLYERLFEALACGVTGERHEQIGGQRLEAARLHDLHAARFGRLVELVDRAPHERHLARQVEVVRAARHAGLHHGAPVPCVGTDEVEYHARARGHRLQRVGLADVCTKRLRRLHPDLAQHLRRLLGVACGRCPGELLL